jgi:hypothetical protein
MKIGYILPEPPFQFQQPLGHPRQAAKDVVRVLDKFHLRRGIIILGDHAAGLVVLVVKLVRPIALHVGYSSAVLFFSIFEDVL